MASSEEAAKAIDSLKLAEVHAKIQQQLEACGNDPVATFHYRFLSKNPDILSMEGGVGLNFNDHSKALHQAEVSCRTTILDFNKAEQIECKTGEAWDSSRGKYESNLALLICCTRNRSGMLPPGVRNLIFSATVVWVPNCQELHRVPDALGVCRSRMARGPEMLAVCKIPKDHHPYWPYPTADEGHLMVMANIPDSHGAPSDFRACKLIEVMHNGEPCVAFNQTTIGDETLRLDLVALWPIQPRSSLWCNDVFQVLDNDDGSAPAFNSVYFIGAEPKEQVPAAALLYNLTLVVANEAGVPGSSMDPNPTFIPNEGITWVDAEMQPQPMDIGSGDGHASNTRASVHSVHSTHPVLGTQVQVADTTQAIPCSSTSVTPASTMTGHSQTPFSSTPLSYPGAPMLLTQLPVGAAVGAIDLEASHQAWLAMMKYRVRKLLDASTVLCQEYSDIVKAHSGEMEVAHADILYDMNKYSMALHMAIGEWQVDVERALQILGTSPGISTFSTQAEIVRVKTNQFWEKVDTAEVAFLASKRKTEAGRAALLEWMKAELSTKVQAAIQKFVTDKMTTALDVVGPTGDMTPFVAQITQESADFRTHITQVEMECSEFRMHLQTASANQQLDMLTTMSRLLPLMCHLTHPVPSQWPGLMPAPGAGANVVRTGPDKRAPPPDDTERGKPAKVTKVPKSEVVIVSDAASPLSSPAT